MMHAIDRENITRLLKRFGRSTSTESYILFLADNNGMIQSCRTVLAIEREGRQEAMEWLKKQCAEKEVPYNHFLQEVRKIVQIFQSDADQNEHYATLGLSPDATEEDVKRAYRRLSIQYHPDTAETSNEETTDAFIRVSRAYHAIIDGDGLAGRAQPAAGPLPTRNYRTKKKSFVVRFSPRAVLGLALIAGVLIVACLVVSELYSRKVMLTTLHNSGAAFVPPAGKGRTETSQEPMTFAEKLSRAKEADADVTEKKDKEKDIAAADLPRGEFDGQMITPASRQHAKIVEARIQTVPAAETKPKPSHPAGSIAAKEEKKAEQPLPHVAFVSKPGPAPVQVADAAVAAKHPEERQEKVQTPEKPQKEVAQKAEPVIQRPAKDVVPASADTAPAKTESVQVAQSVALPSHQADRQEKIQFLRNKQKEAAQNAEPVIPQPEKDVVLASAGIVPAKTETVQVAQTAAPPNHQDVEQDNAKTPENKRKEDAHRAEPVIQQPEKDVVQPPADTASPKSEAVQSVAVMTTKVQETAIEQQLPEEQLQLRIDRFLANYCNAYSHKNLTEFKSFFAQEATENGKPVVDLLETYTKLFESTEHIALRISKLRWNEPAAGQITLDGRFRIDLDCRNADAVHGAGKIDFILAYDEDSLKIQKMNYSFDQ